MTKVEKILNLLREKQFTEADQKTILSGIILFHEVEEEKIEITEEDWKRLVVHTKGFSNEGFLMGKAMLAFLDNDGKKATIYYHKWLDEQYEAYTIDEKADDLFARYLPIRDNLGIDFGFREWVEKKVTEIPKNSFDFFVFSGILEDDSKTSLGLLFQAYDINDTRPFLSFVIADRYFDLKIWEQALKYGLQYIELGKPDYVDFFGLGYATVRASYYRLKDYKQALVYFKKEVALDNEFKNKDEIFADIYFKLKNYEKSLKHCEVAIANKPSKWLVSLKKRALKAIANGKNDLPHSPEFKDEPGIAGMKKELVIDINRESKFAVTPGSERDLENHFYSRIVGEGVFDNKRVKLYKEGRQVHLKHAGRIDLFLEDVNSGDLILIELKNEIQNTDVIEQIIRYRDYVQKNIAQKNQQVCCVIAFYHAKDEFIKHVKLNFPFIQLLKMNFDYTTL